MKKLSSIIFISSLALVGCLDQRDDAASPSLDAGDAKYSFYVPSAIDDGVSTDLISKTHEGPELSRSNFEVPELGVFKPQKTEDQYISVTPRVYNPAYTPLCTQLQVNTTYTLSGTAPGTALCYYFQVTNDPVSITSENVKIVGRIFNQAANNDHWLRVGQDDPDFPNSFPLVFNNPVTGSGEERVQFLSDDGHYYFFIDAIDSTGAPFNIRLDAIHNYDDQELSEGVATAHALATETEVTGNLDWAQDQDVYSYTTVGTEIAIQVSAHATAHQALFSLDGGLNWGAVGTGLWTLSVDPGTNLLFAFVQGTQPDATRAYTFEIFDDRGVEIHSLVGQIVNSQNRNTGENFLNQTITGYTYNNYPITGGVYRHHVRFFGQLKIPSPNGLVPAKFRKFKIDWTQRDNGIGGRYFEEDLLTDEDGRYDFVVYLDECYGYTTHTKQQSGVDPDLWFAFDVETYHITAEAASAPSGVRQYNTANEKFFNLCEVREDDQYGRSLNLFTYD